MVVWNFIHISIVCLYIWSARSTFFQITSIDIFPLCWNGHNDIAQESLLWLSKYGRPRLNPWDRKILWRRKWQPTPVFLPGKSYGWRSLMSYSPRGHKELDMTEWFHFHFLFNLLYCPQITTGSKTKILSFLLKMKQWIFSLKSISYSFLRNKHFLKIAKANLCFLLCGSFEKCDNILKLSYYHYHVISLLTKMMCNCVLS